MLSGLSYNIGGFVGGIGNIILGIIEIELGLRALIDTINFFGFFALALVLVSVITWPKSKSPAIMYSD